MKYTERPRRGPYPIPRGSKGPSRRIMAGPRGSSIACATPAPPEAPKYTGPIHRVDATMWLDDEWNVTAFEVHVHDDPHGDDPPIDYYDVDRFWPRVGGMNPGRMGLLGKLRWQIEKRLDHDRG